LDFYKSFTRPKNSFSLVDIVMKAKETLLILSYVLLF